MHLPLVSPVSMRHLEHPALLNEHRTSSLQALLQILEASLQRPDTHLVQVSSCPVATQSVSAAHLSSQRRWAGAHVPLASVPTLRHTEQPSEAAAPPEATQWESSWQGSLQRLVACWQKPLVSVGMTRAQLVHPVVEGLHCALLRHGRRHSLLTSRHCRLLGVTTSRQVWHPVVDAAQNALPWLLAVQ